MIQVANYPVDKDILKKIAQITDAKFFEAKNKSELEAIYQEIDKLEKSEVELKVKQDLSRAISMAPGIGNFVFNFGISAL